MNAYLTVMSPLASQAKMLLGAESHNSDSRRLEIRTRPMASFCQTTAQRAECRHMVSPVAAGKPGPNRKFRR
jgi:hypothetical protein